jgi:hypothetical protein
LGRQRWPLKKSVLIEWSLFTRIIGKSYNNKNRQAYKKFLFVLNACFLQYFSTQYTHLKGKLASRWWFSILLLKWSTVLPPIYWRSLNTGAVIISSYTATSFQ